MSRPATLQEGSTTLAAIGCYTAVSGGPAGAGRGVVVARLGVDGAGSGVVAELEADSPSFLAWSNDGRHLHAVHETSPGAVSEYLVDLDHDLPNLLQVSTRSSGGDRPCHVATDPCGAVLVVCNYSGGPVLISTPGARQVVAGDHPHHAVFMDHGRQLVTCDLGRDQVTLHQTADLPVRRQVLSMPRGSGPRHAALLDERHLVVVGEHDATLAVIRVDDGRLVRLATVAGTVHGPRAWPSELASATIGGERHLVVGHRRPGHLSLHRVLDTPDGPRLQYSHEHVLPSDNARHLAVDPDTGVAWVALQDDNRVVAVDLVDGRIRGELQTGSPSCVALRPGPVAAIA